MKRGLVLLISLILVLVLLISINFTINANVVKENNVDLYGIFEKKITNSKNYNNPFNYNEIELKTRFISPSGKEYNFYGFYDGNGNRGQTGNVWRFRFMPNEIGEWKYLYSWSDGTTGGSGTFNVIESNLPGLLKVDSETPHFFEDSRGNDIFFRGYGSGSINGNTINVPWNQFSSVYTKIFNEGVKPGRYNLLTMDCPLVPGNNKIGWWYGGKVDKFDVEIWNEYEKIISMGYENKVYMVSIACMVMQNDKQYLTDNYIKYFHARFSSYYNFYAYSPTWEWYDVYSEQEINSIMKRIDKYNPYNKLLAAHDASPNSFKDWADFSLRQKQSRTIWEGNCRSCALVYSPFDKKPIIGAEDMWETPSGTYGQPRNKEEVRRASWGIVMAGIIPVYMEWHQWTNTPGNLPGETDYLIMLNFVEKTNYRKYQQLNHLVNQKTQIASGIPNQEYLIYNMGGEINLNFITGQKYEVIWLNPRTGAETNIGEKIIGQKESPHFSGESVLFLRKKQIIQNNQTTNAPPIVQNNTLNNTTPINQNPIQNTETNNVQNDNTNPYSINIIYEQETSNKETTYSSQENYTLPIPTQQNNTETLQTNTAQEIQNNNINNENQKIEENKTETKINKELSEIQTSNKKGLLAFFMLLVIFILVAIIFYILLKKKAINQLPEYKPFEIKKQYPLDPRYYRRN